MGYIRQGVANTTARQLPIMLGSFEFENVRQNLKIALGKADAKNIKMESLKFNINKIILPTNLFTKYDAYESNC
jgi:hypothetical protein